MANRYVYQIDVSSEENDLPNEGDWDYITGRVIADTYIEAMIQTINRFYEAEINPNVAPGFIRSITLRWLDKVDD